MVRQMTDASVDSYIRLAPWLCCVLMVQSKEPERMHLRLREEECQRSQGPDEYAPKDTSFAGMLRALVAGGKAARIAKSMGAKPEDACPCSFVCMRYRGLIVTNDAAHGSSQHASRGVPLSQKPPKLGLWSLPTFPASA